MSTLINDLTEVFDKEMLLYADLLAIGAEKKNIILKNDIETLGTMNTVESSIINKINRLEKERIVIIKDMCSVLSINPENFTLREIAETLTVEEDKQKILEIRDNLNDTMQKLGEVTQTNNMLIESSLEYIDFSLNIYRSANEPIDAGYEKEIKNSKKQ